MDKQIIKSQFNQLSLSEQADILSTLISSYGENIDNATSGNLPQDKTDSIRDTLQENKETSTAPQYNGVYFEPSFPESNYQMKQPLFNITYYNKLTNKHETMTFARNGGIEDAFVIQGISVIDCKDTLEATIKIKEIMMPHEQDFPELWKIENWFDEINYTDLFKLFSNEGKGALNNTHYAGFQSPTGSHCNASYSSYQWFPLRIDGKFIFLCSSLDNETARFEFGTEDDAHLVGSFGN